jgi:hypothetical protein
VGVQLYGRWEDSVKQGTTRFLVAIIFSVLLTPVACTDMDDEGPGSDGTTDTSAAVSPRLYRAPAISNIVDGVIWEAGNWEPHLAAGDEGVSWGNHRAVVEVGDAAVGGAEELAGGAAETGATPAQERDAVFVTIPWRRRDTDPASKGVIVVDAGSGEAIQNALATRIENASGDVVFQPNPGSSVYHVYYLPWQSSGGYYPTVTYPTPAELQVAVRESGGIAAGEAENPSRAQQAGRTGFSWVGLAPNPDPDWEAGLGSSILDDLPRGTTTHIQSVDDFHSFFPMEVIATPDEEAAFWAEIGAVGGDAADQEWAVIPEHRDYPIRMRHFIPQHWTGRVATSVLPTISDVSAETSGVREAGANTAEALTTFSSQVLRDEAFTFQLGVVSGSEPLDDLSVTFDGFPESWSETLTCFNCEGIDETGLPFDKDIHVSAEQSGPEADSSERAVVVSSETVEGSAAGTLQPLWIGVRVPEDQDPGPVEGTVTVASNNRGSRSIHLSLDVQDGHAHNGGADEPELQTRLAWLNSTVGTDPDFIIEPFEPVSLGTWEDGAGLGDSTGISAPALSILGRRVELGPTGFPNQIFSYFTPELTHFADDPEPILARPLALRVITPGNHVEEFSSSPFEMRQEARGRAEWTVESTSDYLDMTVTGALEYDGMLDLRITLVATSDAAIDDIGLPVSLVPGAAEYMLGLGQKGGKRPAVVDWKWAVENHQEGVWLGGVHKGLQYVLRDENYVRPLNTNFYRNQPLDMPPSWFNGGQGGIQIFEERDPTVAEVGAPGTFAVTAYNYSGPRQVMEGDTLHFNVRFLITPFKPIDTGAHFNTRFVHQYVPVDSVRAWGGTVVNIHHANEINPYINYPFYNLDLLKAYIDEAHEKGIKVKLYNTIRELTYKAHELFAMRSLGDEILNDGEGGGHSWMQEHLEGDYHSAWHASRTDDAAMLNKGTSRWTNYYIEGINWLAANQQIDGLYLDDIAFSRETVKRLVTVLDENRPEVVIDLHSANQFNVRDGFTNSAMLYMEHFPFISRLWFGEYFEYGLDEDYWMTEVAGLPFGLMGEMLQDGGHPYRGMLYGMTARKYGNVDPRPVWAMMNDFGIAESLMLGYWLEDAPVTTDHPRVLATTYVRPDRILIALASWSEEDVVVELSAGWGALGMGGEAQTGIRAYAPAVEGLQPGGEVDPSAVMVPAGQGLFLVMENRPNAATGH